MFVRALGSASLVVLVASLGAGEALAGVEGRLETAPGVRARARREVAWRPPAAAAAWGRLQAALGPAEAIWDRDTGVPSRVWGVGVPAPGSVASSRAAARFARAFLAEHLDLLAPGSRVEDFELVGDDLTGGVRSLGFAQRHAGRPVLGGQVSFRFKNDRLALVGSEALPRVRAVLADSPIDAASAAGRALAWIRGEAPTAVTGSVAGPFILPLVQPGRATSYREVLRVEVGAERPLQRWHVYVDAGTGEPVARASTLVEASGGLRFDVPTRSPSYGPRAERPARFLDVTVDGAEVTTDAAGAVQFDAAEVELVAGVTGTYVRVVNALGFPLNQSFPLADGGDVVWGAPDDALLEAQLNAYASADLAKEYVRGIAEDLPWLDQQMKVVVNSGDGKCNAMSDGDSLYFFQGEPEVCEHTARIADVVYHELGHSVHSQSLIPGVGLFDSALSEGISDYLGATITGDASVGRGFFLTEDPLRELDPDIKEWHWPEDRGEAHDEGRIIGGTLWDLRDAMIAELGEAEGVALVDKIWYEGTRRAVDIPSMYPEALLVDDDDGDLSNGTPHACQINEVFHAHGLVGGAVLGGRARTLEALADGSVPVELEIEASDRPCLDLAPEAATLQWRVRGTKEAEEAVMGTIAGGFAAALPAFPDGTVLEYRVIAELSDGTETRFPDNDGDPWYQRYYGPVVPIYCTGFEGDPTQEGWALFGEWEFGAAGGKSGDPAAAREGGALIGTDLSGDGRYGPTRVSTLRGPTLDVSGYPQVRLQYQRWLAVEDAFFDQASIVADGATVWQNFNSNMGDQSDVHTRDREWRFHDVDLTAASQDGSLELTFRLASDGGLELGGWNLDALCVVGVEAGATPTCGDGVIGEGEACDDGNLEPGDGCDEACALEPEPTTGDDDGEEPAPETTGEPPAGDDAGGEDVLDDEGCGCRSAASGDLGAGLLLLLAGWRRRKRA